jgi:hypothetical protein
MSKRTILVSCAGVAFLVALIAAFLVGANVGANQFLLLESSVTGALRVHELRALRAGKVQELVGAKEAELDSQVLLYSRLVSEGQQWVLWPLSSSVNHERYLRLIAAYRKEFPSQMSARVEEVAPAMQAELREAQAVVEHTTQEIIRRYGP